MPNLDQAEENFQGIVMGPEDRQRFAEIRDQMNAVKFLTAMDREACREIYMRCGAKASRETLEKAVHGTYRTLKMMLAES